MIRRPVLLLFALFGLPAVLSAEDRLPTPDYHRQPSDPDWLVQVVQFHGHLGPSIVAGARMGMIGLRAVDAKGFFDVEVTCEGPLVKPPESCFLDGLQAGTGATMGKRTLHWTQADKLVVRVKNKRTGKTAELRPTPALLAMFISPKSDPGKASERHPGRPDHQHIEAVARKIVAMPDNEIAAVTILKVKAAE
jgi:formylmethanofuran dehydrogenase subunit E